MKRRAAFLAAFLAAACISAEAAEDKVYLYNFDGQVTLTRNKRSVQPEFDMVCKPGDLLRTDTESFIDLALNKCSGARVMESSQCRIVKTAASEMKLELVEGGLLCIVRYLTSGGEFRVDTKAGSALAEARCEFVVRNSKSADGTLVSTFLNKKGKLSVSSRLAGASITLIEGQAIDVPEKPQIPAIRGITEEEEGLMNQLLTVYVPEE